MRLGDPKRALVMEFDAVREELRADAPRVCRFRPEGLRVAQLQAPEGCSVYDARGVVESARAAERAGEGDVHRVPLEVEAVELDLGGREPPVRAVGGLAVDGEAGLDGFLADGVRRGRDAGGAPPAGVRWVGVGLRDANAQKGVHGGVCGGWWGTWKNM